MSPVSQQQTLSRDAMCTSLTVIRGCDAHVDAAVMLPS
jgi:hypothetical protein